MAKRLSEIEATSGPAVHTKSVGVDGLTTEEAPKAVKQPKTRKLAVIHPEGQIEQVEQEQQDQATEEQPTETAAVAPVKPALYKCSHHDARFPGEAQMLPLEAFPLRAEDGRRNGVYCRKCQTKMHGEYAKRKRVQARNSVDALNAQVEKKRAELAALEQQLNDALEHQIAKIEQAE
jgi:hypothetical protein